MQFHHVGGRVGRHPHRETVRDVLEFGGRIPGNGPVDDQVHRDPRFEVLAGDEGIRRDLLRRDPGSRTHAVACGRLMVNLQLRVTAG